MDFDLGEEQRLLKESLEGLLGLPFPESYSGTGGGPVETMIAMEAFGRALTLEPFFATVVVGGGFLRHGGSAEQCAELVPKIANGSLTLAFAHTERQSRYDLHDVETRAERDGAGWVLDGEKGVVLHGDTADKLIVTARIGGNRRDHDGVAAFVVDRS